MFKGFLKHLLYRYSSTFESLPHLNCVLPTFSSERLPCHHSASEYSRIEPSFSDVSILQLCIRLHYHPLYTKGILQLRLKQRSNAPSIPKQAIPQSSSVQDICDKSIFQKLQFALIHGLIRFHTMSLSQLQMVILTSKWSKY